MPELKFNFTIAKLKRLINATASLFPIPTELDWEMNSVPIFTKDEWVRECYIRYFADVVYRCEQRQAMDAGTASVTKDPKIAT